MYLICCGTTKTFTSHIKGKLWKIFRLKLNTFSEITESGSFYKASMMLRYSPTAVSIVDTIELTLE